MSEWLSRRLTEQGIIREEEREIYRYGISNGLIILLNLFTALFIGLFSGHLVTAAAFSFFFMFLRSYSGGCHSDSRVFCYLASSAVLLIPIYTSSVMMKLPVAAVLFILSAAAVIIWIMSPMDSPRRKLDREEKRHFGTRARLILAAELVLFTLLYGFQYMELAYAAFCSFCLIAICMLIGKVILITQYN